MMPPPYPRHCHARDLFGVRSAPSLAVFGEYVLIFFLVTSCSAWGAGRLHRHCPHTLVQASDGFWRRERTHPCRGKLQHLFVKSATLVVKSASLWRFPLHYLEICVVKKICVFIVKSASALLFLNLRCYGNLRLICVFNVKSASLWRKKKKLRLIVKSASKSWNPRLCLFLFIYLFIHSFFYSFIYLFALFYIF